VDDEARWTRGHIPPAIVAFLESIELSQMPDGTDFLCVNRFHAGKSALAMIQLLIVVATLGRLLLGFGGREHLECRRESMENVNSGKHGSHNGNERQWKRNGIGHSNGKPQHSLRCVIWWDGISRRRSDHPRVRRLMGIIWPFDSAFDLRGEMKILVQRDRVDPGGIHRPNVSQSVRSLTLDRYIGSRIVPSRVF